MDSLTNTRQENQGDQVTSTKKAVRDIPPKLALVAFISVSLVGLFFVQGNLNAQRGELSPTYLEPLQDAPPMLALTTQALGGFRGLISSYLWLRANEMQLQKKYQGSNSFHCSLYGFCGVKNRKHMEVGYMVLDIHIFL